MFNKKDETRDTCQLFGKQAQLGYDWWWHSFTGVNEETGEEKQFFIEFFLCNPSLAQDKPTFGQLGEVPSYLMIKVGAWGMGKSQLHKFYPWKDIKVDMSSPFSISTPNCFLNEKKTYGSVTVTKDEANEKQYMCDSGHMEWNLEIKKDIAFNVGYGASKIMRRLQLFEMFWHAQGMKTRFSGDLSYNGVHYTVSEDSSYGYADKNWDKRTTPRTQGMSPSW